MAHTRSITLDQLRQYAVARSLFTPTTLPQAIRKLGFVQADPIRAPARAQDLTLRHRVKNYQAGDLERRYAEMDVEEDFFVNYGFVPRATHALMHPRQARSRWTPARWAQAHAVLTYVQARGVVHPRDVDTHFQHGKSKNWFGGSSNASTQLLDGMHYRGLLRVAGREGGTRTYAAREGYELARAQAQALDALGSEAALDALHSETALDAPHSETALDALHSETALDALVDVVLQKYAPLPARTLSGLVMRLELAAPQWRALRRSAFKRAQARLPSAVVDGTTWYWPEGENPASKRHALDDDVRLLAPFDPVVWDRHRFEIFWGWAYRFEAYTPAPKRVRGYYALPLLWRGQVIGWGNVSAKEGALQTALGYVAGKAPRDAAFKPALQTELDRMAGFLGL